MRRAEPVVLLFMLFAVAGCAEAPLLAPDAGEVIAFAPGHCALGVSDSDAETAIAELLAEINALEAAGTLNAGQARALRNHLSNASRSLDRGQVCAALAQLRAFREQVGNFVDAGVLAPGEAAPLLDASDTIIDGPPIANPSFEADGVIGSFYIQPPTGWTLEGISDFATDQFGGDVDAATSFEAHFVTDGTYGGRFFSRTGANTSGEPQPRTFVPGDMARLYQTIDLTGVDAVRFDAELRTPWGEWFSFLEARVLIDGVVVWSAAAIGTYADREIDVSGLSGLHTFEFRLEAIASGEVAFASNWFLFDNVRLLP